VLGGLDKLDGGAGVDTFNISDTNTAANASFSLPTGLSISNIEKINVTTNGGVTLDTSAIAGVKTVSTTAAGTNNTSLTVSATTDVNSVVAGAATTTIAGGKVVSVTGVTGATSVIGNGLTAVTVNGGGAVTIDNTSTAATPVSAKGTTLTSVTLNAVNAASAIKGEGLTDITVKGATAAAQTVTVTDAKADHAITLHAVGTGYDSTGAAQTTTFVDSAAKTITVDATGAKSNVSLAGSTAATTVNITGSADLTLAALASATKVDGSAATGALTLGTLAAGTVSIATGAGADTFGIAATAKFTADAGAGNDVVTLASAVAAGSTLNLGAGDDKLLSAAGSVAASTASATTVIDGGAGIDVISASLINNGNAAQFTNFEILNLDSTTGLDLALVTGSTITGLSMSSASANATYSNVTHTQGLTVDFVGDNSAFTTTLSLSDVSGTSDTYGIKFNAAAATTAAVAADVKAGTVAVAGVENFTIDSSGTNHWNALTLGADTSANTVKISGASNLDLAFNANFGEVGNNHTGVSLIDGSTATGNLAINTTNVAAATAGLTVNTGSGADTITLGQKATVNAGAGNDTITFSSQGGVATGGAGTDKFDVHLAVTNSADATAAVIANITDMAASETIQFKDASGATDFATAKIDVSGATNLQTALNLAAATNVTANDAHFTWFQYGGNTYVVEDLSTATTLAATDVVVKLTGLHDLSTSTVSASELFTHG